MKGDSFNELWFNHTKGFYADVKINDKNLYYTNAVYISRDVLLREGRKRHKSMYRMVFRDNIGVNTHTHTHTNTHTLTYIYAKEPWHGT